MLQRMWGLSAFMFFIFVSHFSWAQATKCGQGVVKYKLKNNIHAFKMDICTNQYNQFFTRNCQDGCVFKTALANTKTNIKSENGNPGAQLCKQLGFTHYTSEINFNSRATQNIGLCFSPDQTSFVSNAFLADLKE